jgi:5-methylcytosine-specific restriction protein A
LTQGACGRWPVQRPTARQRGYTWDWEKARKLFLAEHPLCRPFAERGRVAEAHEVDHVIPHRGDQDLFWDRANCQPICVDCHLAKSKAEQGAGDRLAGDDIVHPPGLQPSAIPLVIVCGPPAAGKSTYVRDRAGPGDLVIDLDVIKSQISGLPLHAWDSQYLRPALVRRNELLAELSSQPPAWPRAWFIVGAPTARWRGWWRQHLQPERIVVLETPDSICLARIAEAADRASIRAQQSEAVARWWNNYQPAPSDERFAAA